MTTTASTALAFHIDHQPEYALLTVDLAAKQQVFAEPGAMTWMSPTISLKAGFKGGLGKTMGRMFAGESLIVSTYTASDGAGSVSFAPGSSGDIAHYRLNGSTKLMLQRGAFLANGPGVELTGKWQGARGFFSGEGLVLLMAQGTGDVFFNTYGAVFSIDVDGEYLVDTGYIVAFEDTLTYRISTVPGLRPGSKLKSFFLGGEGFVCRFSGRGRLWVQTRQIGSFLGWVYPYRPTKNDN